MAKKKPKGKKKSSDNSIALAQLLIIQALIDLVKSIFELIEKMLD